MKKRLVASILGIAATIATVASSFGQGQCWFDNYSSTVNYQAIKYTANLSQLPASLASVAGQAVGSSFKVNLWYGIGANPASLTDSGVTVNINPALMGGGYFQGPIITVPGYTTGPVTFKMLAWETAGAYGGADFATSQLKGQWTWTEPAIGLPGNPATLFTALPSSLAVTFIPEPTTLSLAVFGAASLLLVRRRK